MCAMSGGEVGASFERVPPKTKTPAGIPAAVAGEPRFKDALFMDVDKEGHDAGEVT